MTTVRIEILPPWEESGLADLQTLLQGQPGRPADWADHLLEDLRHRKDAKYAFFVRAGDEQGRMLGGALVADLRHPGDRESRPWLCALWVHPDFRSRGLGRKLAQMADQAVRERGAFELLVRVHPDDDSALFMAERWGYFREEVLMSKSLTL